MTIGIDISQIVYEGTGVARYVRMMVDAICTYDNENDYIFFFSSLRRIVPPDIEQKITQKHKLVKFKLPPTVLNILWNRFHIITINQLIGMCDVFISSDWTQPPTSGNTKKITVVHDLVYLKYPETVHPKIIAAQKRRMEWVKKEVDMIIADSQSTKQDLIDLLDIKANNIKVVYPAVEIQKPPINDINHIYTKYSILNTKCLLAVGKLEPRKNIPRLISAFQKANLKNTQLIIVGPEGWSALDSPGVTKLAPRGWRDQQNVRFLGFVPDEDLYSLYSNALFFIYPSLYEGFGYPIVEAMSMGCPVATSNTSSMKEIADDSALLFDPHSEEDMIEAMETLSANEKLRKELVEKGKKRAEEFTEKRFYIDFLNIFKLIYSASQAL